MRGLWELSSHKKDLSPDMSKLVPSPYSSPCEDTVNSLLKIRKNPLLYPDKTVILRLLPSKTVRNNALFIVVTALWQFFLITAAQID